MQASIHTIGDADDAHAGSALLDDGRLVGFGAAAWSGNGLRHLRVGQRVSVTLDDTGSVVTRLWIAGIGEGEPIP
ncbi:MAG: hypothetical protein KBB39_15285 [Phycicoccus sp.]|nr:hypothetical protein [Phycicoccus sp.]